MTAERPSPADDDLARHLPFVRRLALALVRHPAQADDLAQDAAAAWLAQRDGWQVRAGGLRGWLARAVRSLAIDRGRAERARRALEGALAETGSGESLVERPDELLARLERQRQVVAAVQQLPEPYRATIVSRYLDELPYEAIAGRTGVPAATVRKRCERGLALLRERLDGADGGRSGAFGLLLLEPHLRRQVAAQAATVGVAGVVQGASIMGSKALVGVAAVVVAVACGVWFWTNEDDSSMGIEVGGRGVVVSAAVAAVREAAAPQREAVVTPATKGALPGTTLRVHGLVFVDGERRAPEGLAIESRSTIEGIFTRVGEAEALHWDAPTASWSITLPEVGAPTSLWITSAATVPAQVPVPAELLEHGGVLDLYLASGRTLALQFLDEGTRAPLAGLEFEVDRSLEIRRFRGGIESRSGQSRHRTDAEGRAVIAGIPDRGHVSVLVDFVRRRRHLLMRDGHPMQADWPARPCWSIALSPDLPPQLEGIVLASVPLGDARATGQVPAWAVPQGAGPAAVRVVTRERAKVGTDASGLGDRYVLPLDAQGGFELVAGAPSQHVVWLQRASDGTALSTVTELAFDRAGPQPAIVFSPLVQRMLAVRCDQVPIEGVLEVVTVGGVGAGQPLRHACAGQPLSFEVQVVEGTSLQFRLLAGKGEDRKAAWSRLVRIDATTQRELRLDLAGSWRSLELRVEGGEPMALRAIGMMRCRAGRVVTDERIVVPCEGDRSAAAVFVPAGQWCFFAETAAGVTGWGIVDVPTAANGPLVLVARQLPLAAAGLRPAARIDSIDGVSLQDLPERVRTVPVPATGDTVLVPLGAEVAPIPR